MNHRDAIIGSNKSIAATLLGISVALLTLIVPFSDKFSNGGILFFFVLSTIILAIYLFAVSIFLFDSAMIATMKEDDTKIEKRYNSGNRFLLTAFLILLVEPALVMLLLNYLILAGVCIAALLALIIAYYFNRLG